MAKKEKSCDGSELGSCDCYCWCNDKQKNELFAATASVDSLLPHQ